MKKNLFVIASLAVLAMGCVKEQQPDAGNLAEQAKTTTLKVSIDQTKVAVSEVDGACTWQEGDEIAMWFKTAETSSTDASGNTVVNDEGSRVVFTYVETGVDGKAIFETTDAIPDEYSTVRIAHPAESIAETGALSLPKTYVYNTEKIPVYVMARINESKDTDNQGSITIEDDQIEATLIHNAAVMKFTLHDVPAYAAGLVVETKRANGTPILVTTKFPYKTGYTADPADHSNDVVLYSPVAYDSYPYQVYLIDGNADEIEGSNKYFKSTAENMLVAGDYIKMPVIDFKKSELRKDYVLLYGVKWAKGNLRYDSNVTSTGFQAGWGLTSEQWDYTGYDVKTSTVSGVTYTYDDTTPTQMRISRTMNRFDHFNFGGIGKFSYDNDNHIKLTTNGSDISGKLYSDVAGTIEVSGNNRFVSEGTDTPALYGDLAFWASKGQYRLPNADDMAPIHDVTSKIFGYHVVDGVKIWGLLFRYPDLGHDRDSDKAANDNTEFTKADLETGLFFPRGGRVSRNNPDAIINQRTQSAFRSSYFVRINDAGDRYLAAYYTDKFYNTFDSNNKDWDAPAGFMIRPVLVEQ